MIGRCDRCDPLRRFGATGQRYEKPIAHWRCSNCGGPLRNKIRGETEANIVDAVRLSPSTTEPSNGA